MRIGRQPVLPQPRPGIQRAQLAHAPGQHGTQQAARAVEQPIHIRRHPLRQPILQSLYAERQQHTPQQPQQHAQPRPNSPWAAQRHQRDQKAHGHIAQQIGNDVKARPIPWQRVRHKAPPRQAIAAPRRERVERGIHNQAGIHPHQGPRRRALRGLVVCRRRGCRRWAHGHAG